VILFSSILFEQHQEEIIFSDTANIICQPTDYGGAIGVDILDDYLF
jgi:hypothetical protein